MEYAAAIKPMTMNCMAGKTLPDVSVSVTAEGVDRELEDGGGCGS